MRRDIRILAIILCLSVASLGVLFAIARFDLHETETASSDPHGPTVETDTETTSVIEDLQIEGNATRFAGEKSNGYLYVSVFDGGVPVTDCAVALTELGSDGRRGATTNADGETEFGLLAHGEYMIQAEYAPKGDIAVASLTSQNPVAAVQLNLKEMYSLAGTVVSKEDRAIPGAEVSVRAVDRAHVTLLTAITAEDGIFSPGLLARNAYLLEATAANYSAGRRYIELTANQTVKLVLLHGVVLTGSVRTVEGVPVPGFELILTPEDFPWRQHFRTSDAKGEFELSDLSSGTYRLATKHAIYCLESSMPHTVEIRTGSHNQLDLTVVKGFQVSGRVYDVVSSDAIAGASVSAQRLPERLEAWMAAPTSTTGEYALPALPPGEFEVALTGLPSDYGTIAEHRVHLSLQGERTESTVNFPLNSGKAVTGIVVNELGEPVAGAQVYLVGNITWNHPGVVRQQTLSDAAGQFRFSNVEERGQRTPFWAEELKDVPQDIFQLGLWAKRGQSMSDPVPPFYLDTAQGHLFELALKGKALGSVSGTVFSDARSPIQAMVRLNPDAKVSTESDIVAMSDLDGRFSFVNVRPGSYTLETSLLSKESLVHFAPSIPLNLLPGQRVNGLEVMAQALQPSISGRLVDASGEPLAFYSFDIEPLDSEAESLLMSTLTDSQGSFQLPNTEASLFRMRGTLPDGSGTWVHDIAWGEDLVISLESVTGED